MKTDVPRFEDTEEIDDVPSFEDTEEVVDEKPGLGMAALKSAASAAFPLVGATAKLVGATPDETKRGFVQGGTFNFSDEGKGGIEAAAEKVMGDERPFGDIYRERRDLERAKNEAAKKEAPGAYLGGEILGGAGTAMIPGTQGLTVAKLGGTGAIQGIGRSKADLMKGDVLGVGKDAALNALTNIMLGKGIQGLAYGAEKAAPYVAKGFDFLGKKVGSIAEDLSGMPAWLGNVVRREGPEIYQGTSGTEQALEGAVEGIQGVVQKAKSAAGKAVGAEEKALGLPSTLAEKYHASLGPAGKLEDLGAEQIIPQAEAILSKEGIQGADAIPAILRLQRQIGDIRKFGREGLSKVSSETDAYLSQLYDDMGSKLDELAGPLQSARSNYAGVKDIYEGARKKFDTVPKALSTIRAQLQEGLRSVDPDVKAISQLPGGQQAMDTAKNEVTRHALKTSDSQRGGSLGLGARVLGLTADRAGRVIQKSQGIADKIGDVLKKAPQLLGAYARPLAAAMSRGTMPATHYVMWENDPGYREKLRALENDQEIDNQQQ